MSVKEPQDSRDTEAGLLLKDYSKFGNRKLNKILRLRDKQIAAAEAGKPTTEKRIAQLKYERETIMTTLLERAIGLAKRIPYDGSH